jgi:hypothetical protein
VAAGSISFPSRYRGLATTLVLAMFDLGSLFGQPAVGAIIVACRRLGLPGYPLMFTAVAGTLAAVAGTYALATRTAAARTAEAPVIAEAQESGSER